MSDLIVLLRRKPNLYTEQGASTNWIEQAEKSLGLTFSSDYKECLREFGAISFGSHELTGFSADQNLDVVETTCRNRKKNNACDNLYVIEEAHIDGIVIWQNSKGEIFQTVPYGSPQKICNSFVEYLEL